MQIVRLTILTHQKLKKQLHKKQRIVLAHTLGNPFDLDKIKKI